MKAYTKEEKFMIALNELSTEAGEEQAEISRYAVGERVGLHPKGVDTICNQLAQANFIKKRGDVLITLTPNGYTLLKALKGD